MYKQTPGFLCKAQDFPNFVTKQSFSSKAGGKGKKKKPQALPELKPQKPEKGEREGKEAVSNLSVISTKDVKSQKKIYHSNGQVKQDTSETLSSPSLLSDLRGHPAQFDLGKSSALGCEVFKESEQLPFLNTLSEAPWLFWGLHTGIGSPT